MTLTRSVLFTGESTGRGEGDQRGLGKGGGGRGGKSWMCCLPPSSGLVGAGCGMVSNMDGRPRRAATLGEGEVVMLVVWMACDDAQRLCAFVCEGGRCGNE